MIIVTGGSGLLGAHFLFELSKNHKQVVGLKRVHSKVDWIKQFFKYRAPDQYQELWSRIVWREADMLNEHELESALQDATLVFHCAATVEFSPKNPNALIRNNVDGTANIVNTLLQLPQSVKLVHVSSIAALGKPETGNTITVHTEWKADTEHSAYSISKYYSELESWRAYHEGLQVLTVLPGLIVGIGDKQSPSMAPFNLIANKQRYVSKGIVGLVSASDVVNQTLFLLDQPDAWGKRFVMVAENWSYKKFLSEIAHAMEASPQFKLISKKWLKRLAWLERVAHWITGKPRRLTPATINALTNVFDYDGQAVISYTNRPYEPIAESINRVAQWYKQVD